MTPAEDKVLHYLQQFKTITPKECWLDLGIYRLGAAVHRLRERGYPISTTIISVSNRFGDKVRVARYELHQGIADEKEECHRRPPHPA